RAPSLSRREYHLTPAILVPAASRQFAWTFRLALRTDQGLCLPVPPAAVLPAPSRLVPECSTIRHDSKDACLAVPHRCNNNLLRPMAPDSVHLDLWLRIDVW